MNNLNIKNIKEKFYIEIIWNDLIFQKFKNKVIIDKEKIRNEIMQNPEKNYQSELLLSEILFDANSKIDFQNRYEKILLDIENKGFKKTALIHSNSETATNGGLIGWIKEDNLSQNIRESISKLKEVSFQPIRTPQDLSSLKLRIKNNIYQN